MLIRAKDSAIVELAEREFGKLSPAERKLFKVASRGEIADYSTGVKETDDPANARNWKSNRVIKANRIAWLCTSSEASKRVTYKGVRITGVRISGELDLSYATIPFHLNLENCALFDGINLDGVTIRALYLIGTHTGPITAESLKVNGHVFMSDGFKAEGEVSLSGATIGGILSCIKGQFCNKDYMAINAANLKVEGDVYMRKGFKAEGEVFLRGATIGGQLDCSAGEFSNKDGTAIDADNLKVVGSVFMSDGFKADGGVILDGVTIGGQLDCATGQFCNENGIAINADRLKVEESVFMRNGFKAEGGVVLLGATISGHFCWTNIKKTKNLSLNLRFAKIGTLWDDEESWPDKGKLQLQGLVYDELDDKAPMEAGLRMKWLRVQYSNEKRGYDNQFFPQPYEHLANVLRKTGYEEDARQILIAKAEDYKRLTNLKRPKKIWYSLLWFIGYGYRPWKASWVILLFILFGTIFFEIGYSDDLMTATNEAAYIKSKDGAVTRQVKKTYPKFNALVYSIDSFVPLVNFHQQNYWLPDANRGSDLFKYGFFSLSSGGLLRVYLWFHISFGWILVSLFAAGLSGLVRI